MLRFFVIGVLGPAAALGCDCIAPPLPKALHFSAAVFTGKAAEKKELAPRDGRRRYEVHFEEANRWKGPKSADIVVYDAEPRGDCQGFGFEAGKDYLVFVRERAVTPDSVGDILPDLWNDILQAGRKILFGELCTNTGELTSTTARETVRRLGKARC